MMSEVRGGANSDQWKGGFMNLVLTRGAKIPEI